ncbi:hypothetical protein I552_5366 [Mycobacterium xenopi 3993]|nr:hypothetical protein I552_5366 [Mycobacterium xenopi 3993]
MEVAVGRWFAHALGGRFAQRVPPPPRTDAYYWPTGRGALRVRPGERPVARPRRLSAEGGLAMMYGAATSGHALGASGGPFAACWRVTAALICAKDQDGLLRHCYKGDVLGLAAP